MDSFLQFEASHCWSNFDQDNRQFATPFFFCYLPNLPALLFCCWLRSPSWAGPQQPSDAETALVQVCRKAVKKGFKLNLMVVGESGLGKSTLVRTTNITPSPLTSRHSHLMRKIFAICTVKHHYGGAKWPIHLHYYNFCKELHWWCLIGELLEIQINSMFLTDLYSREESKAWQPRKTLEVEKRSYWADSTLPKVESKFLIPPSWQAKHNQLPMWCHAIYFHSNIERLKTPLYQFDKKLHFECSNVWQFKCLKIW